LFSLFSPDTVALCPRTSKTSLQPSFDRTRSIECISESGWTWSRRERSSGTWDECRRSRHLLHVGRPLKRVCRRQYPPGHRVFSWSQKRYRDPIRHRYREEARIRRVCRRRRRFHRWTRHRADRNRGMSLEKTVADDRVASDACLVRLSITVRKKCMHAVATITIATHSDR